MSDRRPTGEPPDDAGDDPADPVLVRRARVARLTSLGQRIGYACFGAAVALFFVGLALEMPRWAVTTIVALLVAGSAVLAPAIVFSYAVKAADRADREGDW